MRVKIHATKLGLVVFHLHVRANPVESYSSWAIGEFTEHTCNDIIQGSSEPLHAISRFVGLHPAVQAPDMNEIVYKFGHEN